MISRLQKMMQSHCAEAMSVLSATTESTIATAGTSERQDLVRINTWKTLMHIFIPSIIHSLRYHPNQFLCLENALETSLEIARYTVHCIYNCIKKLHS